MDWFLYDNGLRHERVKYHLCYVLESSKNNFKFTRQKIEESHVKRQNRVIPLKKYIVFLETRDFNLINFGRGSKFSSFAIELRKMTSYFELVT